MRSKQLSRSIDKYFRFILNLIIKLEDMKIYTASFPSSSTYAI